MGLQTPDKIRTLQRKRHPKAKSKPDYRFYLLYDKIYRADVLSHAYRLAKANRGTAGVDGVTFAQIAGREVERNVYNRVRCFLVLRQKLRTRSNRWFPSERVFDELRILLPRSIMDAARRVP